MQGLFFLRQYNDIDHVLPVIYKWSESPEVSVDVVITTQRKYLDDFRIRLLGGRDNVRIRHISDFVADPAMLRPTGDTQPRTLWHKVIGSLGRRRKRQRVFQQNTTSSLPARCYDDEVFVKQLFDATLRTGRRGLVVFDWIRPVEFVATALDEARARHIPTVSLPHGDSPYCNLMENKQNINYEHLENYRTAGTAFDYVVVPNELTARRYSRFLGPDRLKVLGSPRYNRQWMEILADHILQFDPGCDEGMLKLAFFLRPMDYAIHWDEVIQTMRLVLQFPEVRLVIKHHTRESSVTRLMERHAELRTSDNPRVSFALNDISSSSVIRWADVILDLGTSATFEAVKIGKPVLAMEYVQANYLTVSHYMPECEMKCRDHVYDAVEAFIRNPKRRFYSEEHSARFVEEVIGGDDDTLARYVHFLATL